MRTFTLWVFLPATVLLIALAVNDRARGDKRLWRAILIGTVAGTVAAVAYDVFRLPFVFAQAWGIDSVVPQMPLFKVFPRFGAMLLAQPVEQDSYSTAAHTLGWLYHFSNGATFGIMYAALVGEPSRRHWAWAVLMALAIEAALLFSPYTAHFSIAMSALFIVVTLSAHIVFGVALGLWSRMHARQWPVPTPRLIPA